MNTFDTFELLIIKCASLLFLLLYCLRFVIELFKSAKKHEESAHAFDKKIRAILR